MEYKITSHSESETIEFAENLESEKFPNMVICLKGDLGSGKTVFTKGFANALGITDTITSPTFNIVKEYLNGEMALFHMDVYRIDEATVDIDFHEYFVKKGVSIIEWSDMIADELPNERLEISFRIVGENTRVLVIKPFGKRYEDLCEAVL
ncbi:MAG: tRNA (adenosine(37)-N6)-threonylcarbamoyltransferase complex ATPase subunit type 1 TsaE [bacterium]|nr:tRNA (adenosine(37)-N6)-threonylcarbamoyltransferase complex ATPase subunit type 1 TsaE [bacterium]